MKYSSQYQALQFKSEKLRNQKIGDLYRSNEFLKLEWKNFYFDFSKNRIDKETFDLLSQILTGTDFQKFKYDFFSGSEINITEKRAVLHTVLRDVFEEPIVPVNADRIKLTKDNLYKIKEISNNFENQNIRGWTGKPFKNIIHIGIGGSVLGVEMLYSTFKHLYPQNAEVYFLSNADPIPSEIVCKTINPEETLVVVVSKTFTTQETIINYQVIKDWFLQSGCAEANLNKHFVAITAAPEKVSQVFGYILPFNDWVGGRFSLWSSVGLTLALCFGYNFFEKILKGANEIDKHFFEAPIQSNIPAIYALITFWNINFQGINHCLLTPYSGKLNKLIPFLQQLETESNGKSVNRQGEFIDYKTMVSLWGQPGTDAQHSVFQWLHQGTEKVQSDFIGIVEHKGNQEMQQILLSNLFAQIDALTFGKSFETALNELSDSNLGVDEKRALAKQKTLHGNKPNNLILMKNLSPENIGSLIALFEHKVFVLGFLWNINSFDQFGVELGKSIAKDKFQILRKLSNLSFETIVQNLKAYKL